MLKLHFNNQYDFRRDASYAAVLGNDCLIRRLALEKRLKVHKGCVNTIAWNSSGEYILSGSDDLKLVVTNPFNGKVAARLPSGHKRNILQAKFLPVSGNRRLISSDMAGTVSYTQLERPQLYGKSLFNCHSRTVYQLQTIFGEPNLFFSSSEDGTVRWYDTRIKESCVEEDCSENVLLDLQFGVNSIDIDPIRSHYLATGTNDSTIRIFDRRMLSECYMRNVSVREYHVPRPANSTGLGLTSHITCLKYDSTGSKLLANVTTSQLIELDCWTDEVECFEEPPIVTAEEPRAPPDSRNMRVRMRGDWSDTGPSAVLDHEATDGRELSRSEQIFREMSTALTNLLRARAEAVYHADEEESSDSRNPDEQPAASGPVEPSSENAAGIQGGPTPSQQMSKCHGYAGHRNQRTAIKQCAYWGDELVVSGSDCGHIFLWRRDSGKLINIVEADRRVVNCVQPHPYHPLLASSGIDYDVKLWAPSLPEDDTEGKDALIAKVTERNKDILEGAGEVITLPPRFILPMIAAFARRRLTDPTEDG
ncbi:DDB1- and CUL4-associated factor 6-like [Watersipora subatra]|uniref:DDB1- and CUL4-associated factor 6-like n=1 Tax=Watersipora subatra TaxID=2589382 RepID=UPI00355B5A93